jgi:hypothetical protein
VNDETGTGSASVSPEPESSLIPKPVGEHYSAAPAPAV